MDFFGFKLSRSSSDVDWTRTYDIPKHMSPLVTEVKEKDPRGNIRIPMPYTSNDPSHFSYNAAAASASGHQAPPTHHTEGRSVEISEPLKQS